MFLLSQLSIGIANDLGSIDPETPCAKITKTFLADHVGNGKGKIMKNVIFQNANNCVPYPKAQIDDCSPQTHAEYLQFSLSETES